MPPAEELYVENLALKEENAELRAQLEWFKRKVFAGGQSEKLPVADGKQIRLGLPDEVSEAAAPRMEIVSYERRKPSGEKRPLPAETFAKLPVREVIEIVPDEVKAAPECFEKISEERTFEVDVVPPQLFKREIVRPKYRRKDARELPPVIAPALARPVAGGYASAGLLAYIVIAKFENHLPLYAATGIKRVMPGHGLCRVA